MPPPDKAQHVLFTTADDVHDTLGRLMEELATDADVGLRLSRLDTVVQLRYRKPDAKVTLVAREGDAPTVHLGEVPQGTPGPELVLTLDADVGHLLWLGRQNVAIAIARGTVQAKGDTRRVVELLELSKALAPHYEHLLRATGREALLDPEAGQEIAGEEATTAAEPSAEGELAEGDAVAEGTSPEGEASADAGDEQAADGPSADAPAEGDAAA